MQLLMEHYLSEYSKSIDSPSGIEISTMSNLCHEVFFHPGALFKGMDTYIPPVRVLAAGQKDGRKGPSYLIKTIFQLHLSIYTGKSQKRPGMVFQWFLS